MVSFSRPCENRIYFIFPLRIESKALVKSTNNIVACRFFARTPPRIRRIAKIYDFVDLFLRKLFCFLFSMLSILGSKRLPQNSIVYLGCYWFNVYTSVLFLAKGKMYPFVHMSFGFWLDTALQVRTVCRRIAWSPILLGIFHQALIHFYFLIFLVPSRVLLA